VVQRQPSEGEATFRRLTAALFEVSKGRREP